MPTSLFLKVAQHKALPFVSFMAFQVVFLFASQDHQLTSLKTTIPNGIRYSLQHFPIQHQAQ